MGGGRERGKRGGVGWPASTLRRRWRFAAGWMASFKAAGHGQHGVGVGNGGRCCRATLSHVNEDREVYHREARPFHHCRRSAELCRFVLGPEEGTKVLGFFRERQRDCGNSCGEQRRRRDRCGDGVVSSRHGGRTLRRCVRGYDGTMVIGCSRVPSPCSRKILGM